MARRINYAKDGAEPVHWGDAALHLGLLVAGVSAVLLRLLDVVYWSWWVILIPWWLLFALYVASYLAARSEYRRQRTR